MRPAVKTFLGLLVVLSVALVAVIWWWRVTIIDFPGLYSPTQVVMIKVVVAATDIKNAMIIKPEMVTTIEIPQDQAMEVMFFDVEDVIGKIARFPIQKGVIITRPLVTQLE